jgi:hypothetical protein
MGNGASDKDSVPKPLMKSKCIPLVDALGREPCFLNPVSFKPNPES